VKLEIAGGQPGDDPLPSFDPARYGDYRVHDFSWKCRGKNPCSPGENTGEGENNGCQDGKVFETKCKNYYTISFHAESDRMNPYQPGEPQKIPLTRQGPGAKRNEKEIRIIHTPAEYPSFHL
jgi:hypothetical protein